MSDNNRPEEPIVLDAEEARGATKVHAMRYVLGISLVLVVVIFAILLAAKS